MELPWLDEGAIDRCSYVPAIPPVSERYGANVDGIVEVERKNLRLDEVWTDDGESTLSGGVDYRLDHLDPFQTLYARFYHYCIGSTSTVTKKEIIR